MNETIYPLSITSLSDLFITKKVTNPKFSGCFNGVYIKEVIYNAPATIVLWSDGTKTVTKCAEGDEYSKETGLAICVLKKIAGGAQVHKLFEEWLPEGKSNIVTLKDVRAKSK